MKKILICFIILISTVLLYGCNKVKNTNKTEKITQPIVEGEYEVKILNLRYFIPHEMIINEYNGLNMTYDYYVENTGDNCDLLVLLKGISAYENSIEKFMNDYIKVSEEEYTKEEINDSIWYIISENKTMSYITKNGDYFYYIKLKINENGTICSRVNDMIKNTLFMVE